MYALFLLLSEMATPGRIARSPFQFCHLYGSDSTTRKDDWQTFWKKVAKLADYVCDTALQ
jgi:hypothetical protein